MPQRPLPRYQGPKLHPFQFQDDGNRAISVGRLLGSGLHARVFEATIDGREYALKLFHFTKPSELVGPHILEEGQATFEDIMSQKDPFNAECRAYGRLKETGREDLAVKCHGYVLLDRQIEDTLAQRVGDWRRPSKADKNRPLRGIVKELVPNDKPPFTFKMLPKMRRDILALNKLGIVAWDLRADNYAEGKIMDFSQACTAPHMDLDLTGRIVNLTDVRECCNQDMAMFDALIAEWNDDHPGQVFYHTFFSDSDYRRRLRNPRQYPFAPHRQKEARFSAALYDWRKPAKAVSAGTQSGQNVLGPRGDGKVQKRSSGTAAKRSKEKTKARS